MNPITPLPAQAGEAAGQGATTGNTTPPAAPAAPTPTPEFIQRLIIQELEELGVFIYTVIDRTTGQVVAQIPRESVSEMASQSSYSAGQVISTTA